MGTDTIIEDNLTASLRTINVMITIDTDKLIKNYPKPSKDHDRPTGIDHSYGFMVVANAEVISGQGTGDLAFKANVGDNVRMNAVSASNNFDEGVILYRIAKFNGDDVFHPFQYKDYYKEAPVPKPDRAWENNIEDVHFWFYESSVKKRGKEDYKVGFSVYTRNENGQPQLYGYFEWDPRVEVSH